MPRAPTQHLARQMVWAFAAGGAARWLAKGLYQVTFSLSVPRLCNFPTCHLMVFALSAID